MADVHGNPEEMRAFAFHLQKFAMELRGLREVTHSKMGHLNESWKDRENTQFTEKYTHAIKPMDALVGTLEEYSAFLKRKAGTLDNYLNTKL